MKSWYRVILKKVSFGIFSIMKTAQNNNKKYRQSPISDQNWSLSKSSKLDIEIELFFVKKTMNHDIVAHVLSYHRFTRS